MGNWMMHAVQIGGDIELIGCTDVAVDHGNEFEELNTDGNIDTTAIFQVGAAPRIAVSSLAVGSVLDEISILTGTDAAFAAWDAKFLSGGAKDSSGHVKYAMANALIFISAITATVKGLASVSFGAVGYDSSGGNPMTVNTSASDLPSIDPASEAYALGPVSVNGNEIAGVQSVSINTGLSFNPVFKDSAIGLKSDHLMRRSPSVQIVTLDPTMQQYVAGGSGPYSGGRAIGVSNVTIKLRRRLPDGTFSASADNVLFTFAHGLVSPATTNGRIRQHTFNVRPRAGASAVIQVNTSAAA